MLSIRPKVAEHALFLLGRSVHPELFHIHRSRHIERSHYRMRIDITSDGHLLTFSSGTVTMSEVVCSAKQALPEKRRLISQVFRVKGVEVVEVKRHVCYQTKFEIEQVGPDVFWMVHDQLSKSSEGRGLCQNFGSSGRIPMGAVSFIHIEERLRNIVVQSLHTFPDDYQILKSYTTFTVDKS
jgi:Protein of unknown function DUF2617